MSLDSSVAAQCVCVCVCVGGALMCVWHWIRCKLWVSKGQGHITDITSFPEPHTQLCKTGRALCTRVHCYCTDQKRCISKPLFCFYFCLQRLSPQEGVLPGKGDFSIPIQDSTFIHHFLLLFSTCYKESTVIFHSLVSATRVASCSLLTPRTPLPHVSSCESASPAESLL